MLVRWVGVDFPVQSVNAYKEHWGQRQLRRELAHHAVKSRLAVNGQAWIRPVLPSSWHWRVTFERRAHGRLDRDNLVSAFKAHRDAVAEVLGLDDRDPRIEWEYEQSLTSERAMVRRLDRKVLRR